MKRNAFFCFCLCICLLFSACGTPVPEESSVPAGVSLESSEAAPEDPNARIARAYLEELLTEDPFAEEGYVYWFTSEQAETVRDCVKKLKTPILTEEDVLALAKRTAEVYFSAWLGELSIILPDCGVLESVHSVTGAFSLYWEHEAAINALLAYTLYLFTPPEYLFWGSEIWNEGWYPSNMESVDPAFALCLPFAPSTADYTSRQGALQTIREQQSCIRLYPLSVSDGVRPLDFTHCGAPDLLFGGECMSLELSEQVRRGEVTIPEEFRLLFEVESLRRNWLYFFLDGAHVGMYSEYSFPNGDEVRVYQLLSPEDAREIRERVEQLPSPILTWETADQLVHAMLACVDPYFPLLLPGIDGGEDVLLPPGMESLADALQWRDESTVPLKACGAAAYLIDLFTPSAYRFTDLFGVEGTYYALDVESDDEDITYLRVLEGRGLYLANTYAMEPLLLA